MEMEKCIFFTICSGIQLSTKVVSSLQWSTELTQPVSVVVVLPARQLCEPVLFWRRLSVRLCVRLSAQNLENR